MLKKILTRRAKTMIITVSFPRYSKSVKFDHSDSTRSSHGYKYLQITKLFSSLPSAYLMSETTRQKDFQVLSRFHTSLPTTKTPATAHTALIASTTMACSLLTLCRLADASRSSAIFRSSLPTEMHALRCDGDSSGDRKSVDAIQILALWKQDMFCFNHKFVFSPISNLHVLWWFKMVCRSLVPNTRLYCLT